MTESPDWVVADLVWSVGLGRERLGDVLDADEHRICDQLQALEGEWGHLYARLISRKPAVFFVPDLREQIPVDLGPTAQELLDRGLALADVTWSERVASSTQPVLSEFCRQLGLSTSGRVAEKRQRLMETTGVAARGLWVRPRFSSLVRLLQQAAFMDKRADVRSLVVERLGLVRWPEYTPTGGSILFRDRAHRVAWQGLWEGLQSESLTPERALEALRSGEGEAVGKLSLVRALQRLVLAQVEGLRNTEPRAALDWLTRLRTARDLPPTTFALIESRILESAGEPSAALQRLEAARRAPDRAQRLAIHRSGRRLASTAGRAWVPEAPLVKAPRRRVYVEQIPSTGPRSRWRVGSYEGPVEAAVVQVLGGLGRRVVHAEGGLIRTLAALLFADIYFLPVPGMLPVPHLSGPLDVGTPRFAANRAEAVDAVLAQILDGQAPTLIARACAAYQGVRLAGVSRDLSDPALLMAVVDSLGPDGLIAVMRPLLARGWGAAKGLPDLLVLSGEAVRLPAAHPKRVPARALWVEVKGPGDTLRDGQRVWLDHLARAGVPVEVWDVSSPS